MIFLKQKTNIWSRNSIQKIYKKSGIQVFNIKIQQNLNNLKNFEEKQQDYSLFLVIFIIIMYYGSLLLTFLHIIMNL